MKKILTAVLSFVLITVSIISVSALDNGSVTRVNDYADLLSDSQETKLREKLDEISEKNQCDVVILTVDELDGKSSQAYADDFYDENGFGFGANYDGILLLVSMGQRDWAISTCGYGITAFTDAGMDYMVDRFKPDLSDGDYYKAFDTYADLCDDFLVQAKTGNPYDVGNLPKTPLGLHWILIALVVGVIIAVIVIGVMINDLKSVRPNNRAADYQKEGSFVLNTQKDMFLYRTVSKTKIQKQSSSGGGSSTHRSSSGRTHGGSSGKF